MKIEFVTGREMLCRFKDKSREVILIENRFVLLTSHDQTFAKELTEDNEQLFIHPEACVWVITKNSDFTEGSGRMLVHKIFRDYDNAVGYVMQQPGVYGSKQGTYNHTGISVAGKPYVVSRFNGYEIMPVKIEDAES